MRISSIVHQNRLMKQQTEDRMNARRERDSELDGLGSLTYHERLTEFVRGSTRHPVKNSITVIDFRPLYAVTLYHLQRRLAQEIQLILAQPTSDVQLERIEKLLGEYSMSHPSGIHVRLSACLLSGLMME